MACLSQDLSTVHFHVQLAETIEDGFLLLGHPVDLRFQKSQLLPQPATVVANFGVLKLCLNERKPSHQVGSFSCVLVELGG